MAGSGQENPQSPAPARLWRWLAAGGVVVAAAVGLWQWTEYSATRAELLRAIPSEIPSRSHLIEFAAARAKPAYAEHCASCHGAEMQGDAKKGAPALNDALWIHGYGSIQDIEQIVLYGIRAGVGRSWNLTDMPAEGRTQQLYDYELRDAIAYILSFTRPVTDPEAVKRGAAIYEGKGNCYDCHSTDGAGVPDYGAPGFRDDNWMWGGSDEDIYNSVYSGRHGICPNWLPVLGPDGAREMAVYLYSVSHKSEPPKAARGAAQSSPAG